MSLKNKKDEKLENLNTSLFRGHRLLSIKVSSFDILQRHAEFNILL